MIFVASAHFFQNSVFQKFSIGLPSDWQTDWFQIRPDKMSGLIWAQTVCKGYQMTLTNEQDRLLIWVTLCMLGFHFVVS